ncbi:MAG: PspA/IM30 family protein [Pseudorhodobacter sp.]
MSHGPATIQAIYRKIQNSETGLRAANETLADLIQRLREENGRIARLDERIEDMTCHARAALHNRRDDWARNAAGKLAQMENERNMRAETSLQLEERMLNLRQTLDRAHRHILTLRQSAETAQVRVTNGEIDKEPTVQLIDAEDPLTNPGILQRIHKDLAQDPLSKRKTEPGFGPEVRVTAEDILNRLKAITSMPKEDPTPPCP